MGRIRLRTLVPALLLALVASAQQEAPQPTFRVDVRLVRMLATVKNPAGQLVGGLGKSDFRVFENNVEQEISLFERTTAQPLSVALLVDTSRSTERERRYELTSVKTFVNALLGSGANPSDSLALFSFNTDVTRLTPFTHSARRTSDALGMLRSEGGTALYDAVYLASQELQGREGRHVVVVVSDGGDTVSKVNFNKALEALHRADAVLYAIVVVPVRGEAGRNLRGENALITLSTWTGGRFFLPTPGADLDAAFSGILDDLRTQYLIGYYPRPGEPTRERFRSVRVEVDRPGHSVTTRNGYFSDDVIDPPSTSRPKPLTPPAAIR